MDQCILAFRLLAIMTFIAFFSEASFAAELPIGTKTYGNAEGCKQIKDVDFSSDSYVYINSRQIRRHENKCNFDQIIKVDKRKWVANLQCQGEGEAYKSTVIIIRKGRELQLTYLSNDRAHPERLSLCGREDNISVLLNHLPNLKSPPAPALLRRGNRFMKKGEYDRAIAAYTQAIKLNPKYAYAFYNRGFTYKKKGEYDKAIADYNQAIKLNPKYAFAYNGRGIVYRKKSEYDKAISDYNQAIKLNPKFYYAYNNRGNIYREKGEYDRAIADYTQAIKLNPKYVDALNHRGGVYEVQHKYDKAIADLNLAIKLQLSDWLSFPWLVKETVCIFVLSRWMVDVRPSTTLE